MTKDLDRMSVAIVRMKQNDSKAEVLAYVVDIHAAENWIAERETIDPLGVYQGDYGIDAPENLLNGKLKLHK